MAEGMTKAEYQNMFTQGPHCEHMARAVAAMADGLVALMDTNEHVEEALYGELVDFCDEWGFDAQTVVDEAHERARKS